MSTATEKEASITTSGAVIAALREKFAPPDYALLTEVPNGTGGHKTRSADALVMSLWPSRGLTLTGIEVKVSRSDWLNELKNPAKADAVCRYCDHWYIAVGDGDIVRDGELPPTWGLFAPKNGKLVIKKQAPDLEAVPTTRAFMAAIFRRVNESEAGAHLLREMEQKHRWNIQDAKREARAEGYKEGQKTAEQLAERYRNEAEKIKRAIEEFTLASGIQFQPWNAGNIGKAVDFVLSDGVEGQAKNIEQIRLYAESILRMTERYDEARKQSRATTPEV